MTFDRAAAPGAAAKSGYPAIFMPHPSLPPPSVNAWLYDVTDANEIEPSIGGRRRV